VNVWKGKEGGGEGEGWSPKIGDLAICARKIWTECCREGGKEGKEGGGERVLHTIEISSSTQQRPNQHGKWFCWLLWTLLGEGKGRRRRSKRKKSGSLGRKGTNYIISTPTETNLLGEGKGGGRGPKRKKSESLGRRGTIIHQHQQRPIQHGRSFFGFFGFFGPCCGREREEGGDPRERKVKVWGEKVPTISHQHQQRPNQHGSGFVVFFGPCWGREREEGGDPRERTVKV
jgi:hypothetical protein